MFTAYKWMYEELAFSPPLQYIAWVIFPLVFINFSTGFVHIVGPNAIGKQLNITFGGKMEYGILLAIVITHLIHIVFRVWHS